MRTERASGNARRLLCWGLAAAFACGGAWAEDVTPAATLDGGDDGMAMPHHHGHGDHSPVPAGVEGANMVGAGQAVFNYRPMFMHMQDNYIGTDKVSPETIATTVPSGRRSRASPPSGGSAVAGRKFIAGAPMNRATKRVRGRW